jgi:hypothetical protein
MTVYPLGIDYPKEQREDNARSLVFDTAPLAQALEIVGESTLTLTLSTDMPEAAITAKLCDVGPDGASALITSGWLRLGRGDGEGIGVRLKLWPIDYLIPAGNRLRLALSLSDFPRIFPVPHRGRILLHFSTGVTQNLALHVLPAKKTMRAVPELGESDLSILEGVEFVYEPIWKVVRDQVSNQVSVTSGMFMEFTPMHMTVPMKASNHYTAAVTEGLPETARLVADSEVAFSLEGTGYVATVHQMVTQDRIETAARIEEEGKVIHEKTFAKDYKA